jgi:hypothetical protein
MPDGQGRWRVALRDTAGQLRLVTLVTDRARELARILARYADEPIHRYGWDGLITVKTFDHERGALEVVSFHNLITDVGKNLMRDGLAGALTDTTIHYCGLGTSGTAPAAGDTQLGAETFRKAMTTYDRTTAKQVKSTCYISPGEAIGAVIAELGWFAGAAATSAANSGVLVAHTLYSHTKTGTESIQVDRTDAF